ncbi:MAG: aminopeptidase N, partial [Bowdeniella nasicola]|nr:aminopeptidase N [Bowdeniella nasicola]
MRTLTRTEAASRSAAISDLDYRIHVDLTNAASGDETFVSTTEAHFVTTTSTIFFDLVAKEVLAVEINGQGANAEVRPGRIVVEDLPTNTAVTVRIVARCYYSSTGEGLHRYRDPEDGRTYLYTQYEPMDAHRVYACFDQPDMKARWSFTIDAPATWTVLSNETAQATERLMPDATRHIFAPTQPLSSYITCIIAGPYHRVVGPTWQGNYPKYDGGPNRDVSIKLAAYCRQALADRFDTDDIFAVTMAGFTFFHERYHYAYPWGGKYDQVFVPEYNLGAMENPGCITFNEHYIPQGEPTRAQCAARGNTILHEMCHMWFGDLVTPKWWDDLWLKESFADHEGTAALASATKYDDAWATFASGRKAWAYQQDQLPTTHPIVADIPDVAAAKQNFDGITYAKGAAVLKQLVAFVGEATFVATAREYFAEHAFGVTTAIDLLTALGRASGRDMSAWADAWLHTFGPSHIHFVPSDAQLRQRATNAVIRPHRLSIGSYRLGERLHRTALTSVELTRASQSLQVPTGDAYLPNDEDLTYAVIELDDDSRQIWLTHLSDVHDPVARAVAWSALIHDLRSARLGADDFLTAVLTHGIGESDSVLAGLLRQCETGWREFLPSSLRHHALAAALTQLEEAYRSDPPRARLWALAYAAAARDCVQVRDHAIDAVPAPLLAELINNPEVARDVKWAARIAQAARGEVSATALRAEHDAAPSGFAATQLREALAALPDTDRAGETWEEMWTAADLSNEMLSATIAG